MKRVSLQFKLMSIFLLTAALVGGASFYGLSTSHQTQDLLFDIINNDFKRITALQKVQTLITDIERDALENQLGLVPKHIDSAASHSTQVKSEIEKQLAIYAKYNNDNLTENRPLITRLKQSARTIADNASILLTRRPLTPEEKNSLFLSLDTQQTIADDALNALLAADRQSIANENAEVNALAKQLNIFAWTSSIGAITVAVLLGLILTRSLIHRIVRLRQAANDIAAGNLTKTLPVTTRDELGDVATGFNNMTARLKESYARLALEKQRDETLLESMGEGVVALDMHGRIVLINTVARNLLELGPNQEVTDKRMSQILTLYNQNNKPISASDMPSALTLHSGKPVSDFYQQFTKDKRKRILNVSANPIVLEEKVAGVIIVLRDVTKEKEVDRMKTEFISLASHQLRTPLSAIKWFTEMLLSGDAGKLKAEQMEFTQNIADSTERMIELVASLLNISRIESGRIIVAPEPTDLHQLVAGIVNDLKAKTEEKKQTLIISVHADLPKIKLDPRLIGQVYLNFLTNAIKYTPKGGEISVFISKKGKDVISQIADNGYGIPKSQQGRVFQKFFRAENVIKHETDGTGLGLYLIKAVIESSGGKVWFESEEGKGTTFWFSLPLSGMKAREGEVTLDV